MKKLRVIALFLTLIFATSTMNVFADVPNTTSIIRRNEGGNLLLDVKVRHADPSTSHYISQINIDLDGTIKSFTDLTKVTTTEATYTINVGSVNPKVVKAQPVCSVHGAAPILRRGGLVEIVGAESQRIRSRQSSVEPCWDLRHS